MPGSSPTAMSPKSVPWYPQPNGRQTNGKTISARSVLVGFDELSHQRVGLVVRIRQHVEAKPALLP